MILTAFQVELTLNAWIIGINVDLAVLLGTTMTSLAISEMSGFRPRITAVMSTGISRFWPASSRNITARPEEASGFVP